MNTRTSYEPAQFEDRIYRFWEDNGFFRASDQNLRGQRAFCMMIPPPNVTGVLHMGHALTNTIQDILVRWRRMKGDNTLWLPGTDHAGIATQVQVERQIEQATPPSTRQEMGRPAFIEQVWKWKEEHGGKIKDQLKRLGSSLDWDRERFTLDEGMSRAVREAFVRLYQQHLIYRGDRIINWCPRCQTALSDLEVVPTERKSSLWYIRYTILNCYDHDGGHDSSNKVAHHSIGSITVATTRPETLLGDAALAVHPDDERYKAFHGQCANLSLPGSLLAKRRIPVVVDAAADPAFGTGALKITPAHDFNDYEIGKRHSLSSYSVMGKDGRITEEGGPSYAGLTFQEARVKILKEVEACGFLVKQEDTVHSVGVCQRCETVVEPLISKQWFVKTQTLAEPAIRVVQEGKVKFFPQNWEKTYFEWMFHIRDWCISRQLWWGHQIPAWYCEACKKITVLREAPERCSHCTAPAAQLKQDEDVLDTWFSASLWPFATLGWPDETAALRNFYPTSILETGFDILFFWVARMLMMGLHLTGEVPFHRVYLHAMVRDEKGEKMSKTRGNVIDPLVLIHQHGADPVRFTLAVMAGQGRDVKLSVDRVAGYRAFCNKLWNATQFVRMQESSFLTQTLLESSHLLSYLEDRLVSHGDSLLLAHRWILSRLQEVIRTVEAGLEAFELNQSAQILYDFVWREFCDWYIELSKNFLKDLQDQQKNREQTFLTLHYVLSTVLKLLHPFIPFITEELWQSLPYGSQNSALMLQSFPRAQGSFECPEAEREMQEFQWVVETLRNFKGENQIPFKTLLTVDFIPGSEEVTQFLRKHEKQFQFLIGVREFRQLTLEARAQRAEASGRVTVIPLSRPAVEFQIGLDDLVDPTVERVRLEKEILKVVANLQFIRTRMQKPGFLEKAPPHLIAQEKQREQELLAKKSDLEFTLKKL